MPTQYWDKLVRVNNTKPVQTTQDVEVLSGPALPVGQSTTLYNQTTVELQWLEH